MANGLDINDPEVFAGAFRRAPLYLAVSSLATGAFVEVNDAFVKVTGYSRAEAVGKSAAELGLWVDPAERAAGLAELKAHGFIREKEVRLCMKSGEQRDFLISAEITELGGEQCVLNAAVDITRRKRAEAALHESDERYRTLFNTTDEGFCVIEVLFEGGVAQDYRFLEVNPQFEAQSGLKKAVGKRIREFSPKLERYWFELFGKVAVTGESERLENSAEELGRWFEVYAFRVGGNSSRRVGVFFKDITRRKQAELALTALNQELESRVKARTQQVQALAAQLTLAEAHERARLAQVLHDDLQQQLYAVQFSLHDIRKALENDLHKDAALDTLEQASERLKDAVAIARTTTANLSPPVLRGEGLVEALRWLSSDMRGRYGFTITVSAPGHLSVPGEPVRVLLFELVRELLFNVVKHADIGAATVTLSEQEERLEITVSDLGRGFDPASLAAEREGSGLGLSGVRKRLELFGGQLQVASTRGEGTGVTISLPIHALTLT